MGEQHEPLWGVREVAEYLGVPATTLDQWRYHGYGPRGRRVGRYERYDPADVRAWFASLSDGVAWPERAAGVGSVQKRVQAGTDSWLARWRDPAGRQRKRSFPRKVDAERFLATVSADLVHGTYVDPNDPTLFRDHAEDWRAPHVHRPTTRAHVKTNLRQHALPGLRPPAVRHDPCQRGAGLGHRSVAQPVPCDRPGHPRHRRGDLQGGSPCEGTKLPKKLPVEITPLTTATVEALIDAVPDRYGAFVVLAAGTGLRQGECFGIVDEGLDLDRRTLRVEQQLILLPRRDPFLAPPKTSASHRSVPPPDVVTAAFREHLRTYPVIRPDGLVFTDEDGRALRRTAFSREVWRPAVAAVRAPRGTGFHDPPALLRLAAHPPRRVDQDRAAPARAHHRRRDPGHLRPPLSGLGRPDP
ncbi:MAG: hypothetical protein QOF00_703 [Pseudonocardiales bacterium]|jgi:integrase|nr:hypothetical protein [Pseudonocardiales bacterium]